MKKNIDEIIDDVLYKSIVNQVDIQFQTRVYSCDSI